MMTTRRTAMLAAGCGLLLLASAGAAPPIASDPLKKGFENPPQSARPRVWWHWMNGNIARTGIQLDLEWMHRVGLAGVQIFDAALATPQVVEKRLAYMTPEWKDAFKYAIETADHLGMEVAIAASPGWSETGGPWVPPSEGMKKYVWSETVVEGGKPLAGALNRPPAVTGPFQSVALNGGEFSSADDAKGKHFYADSVVVAYRRAASDVPLGALHPKMTASAGSPDLAMLSGGDLNKKTGLPVPKEGETAWIQYEFDAPQTVRALSFAMDDADVFATILTGIGSPEKSIEASDDGHNFRFIAKLPDEGAKQRTISFPAVTARFFRVVFKRLPPPPTPLWAAGIDPASLGMKAPTGQATYKIAELKLIPGARVNRFEDKAAFTPLKELDRFATPQFATADAVAKGDVIDLTSKLRKDGTLDWTPPPGTWVVVRFG